ncbi:threonine/serine dehydratase [Agrobacterium vitis]|uniref:Threonine/serine dehydratase n=1 Tax=Agrobacterium vitis TaxID=373 RepID=A0AAE2R809_AGRVI|nr:threonine/serine dehydratase [Agrobacterium vitis]MBF2713188.1 threonine/serine dehydratase [Agrobacterium vitis]
MNISQAAASTPWHLQPPGFDEIEAAAGRIDGHLVKTPLLESERVNRLIGGRLLVKAEGLQRAGSFKARGAWNTLSLMDQQARQRGVIAFSSGNHGQAVAWAANRFGVPAVVIMPQDAPAVKIQRTREWGAEVILYDRLHDDREAIGAAVSGERQLTLIPPFEDRRIVAGAATVAKEIVEQALDMGFMIDALAVSCSGGGLAAGCALAFETMLPQAQVWAAEPEAYDDLRRGLVSGRREKNDLSGRSFCDALLAVTTGSMNFNILSPRLKGSIAVSDKHVAHAMRLAFSEFGLVVEPGGAASLAAVLTGAIPVADQTVAVLLSGANVDADLFREVLGDSK